MSKELSAEEIISLIISNTASQFSGEWKPDIVYTKEELIEIVESFATKRVKEACKVKWFYISKGDLPEHGRQVRVLYENGYVGINNYASNEWVSDNHRTVVMWHELLEIIEPL